MSFSRLQYLVDKSTWANDVNFCVQFKSLVHFMSSVNWSESHTVPGSDSVSRFSFVHMSTCPKQYAIEVQREICSFARPAQFCICLLTSCRRYAVFHSALYIRLSELRAYLILFHWQFLVQPFKWINCCLCLRQFPITTFHGCGHTNEKIQKRTLTMFLETWCSKFVLMEWKR